MKKNRIQFFYNLLISNIQGKKEALRVIRNLSFLLIVFALIKVLGGLIFEKPNAINNGLIDFLLVLIVWKFKNLLVVLFFSFMYLGIAYLNLRNFIIGKPSNLLLSAFMIWVSIRFFQAVNKLRNP